MQHEGIFTSEFDFCREVTRRYNGISEDARVFVSLEGPWNSREGGKDYDFKAEFPQGSLRLEHGIHYELNEHLSTNELDKRLESLRNLIVLALGESPVKVITHENYIVLSRNIDDEGCSPVSPEMAKGLFQLMHAIVDS